MGLDVGDRRIGVAISDPSQTLATPVKTILRRVDNLTFHDITALIKKYNVGRLVVGLPFSLDGSVGKQAEKVLTFKAKLAEHTDVEIVMQDERLSSVTANQRLREAGKKGEKLKNGIDSAAATVILQCYLDTPDQSVST
jgi:putative Holliday junction resolvase